MRHGPQRTRVSTGIRPKRKRITFAPTYLPFSNDRGAAPQQSSRLVTSAASWKHVTNCSPESTNGPSRWGWGERGELGPFRRTNWGLSNCGRRSRAFERPKPQGIAASRSVTFAESLGMSVTSRPQKITFADMREQGARGILVCCADYRGNRIRNPGHGGSQ